VRIKIVLHLARFFRVILYETFDLENALAHEDRRSLPPRPSNENSRAVVSAHASRLLPSSRVWSEYMHPAPLRQEGRWIICCSTLLRNSRGEYAWRDSRCGRSRDRCYFENRSAFIAFHKFVNLRVAAFRLASRSISGAVVAAARSYTCSSRSAGPMERDDSHEDGSRRT